jgi:hypothetical protein
VLRAAATADGAARRQRQPRGRRLPPRRTLISSLLPLELAIRACARSRRALSTSISSWSADSALLYASKSGLAGGASGAAAGAAVSAMVAAVVAGASGAAAVRSAVGTPGAAPRARCGGPARLATRRTPAAHL